MLNKKYYIKITDLEELVKKKFYKKELLAIINESDDALNLSKQFTFDKYSIKYEILSDKIYFIINLLNHRSDDKILERDFIMDLFQAWIKYLEKEKEKEDSQKLLIHEEKQESIDDLLKAAEAKVVHNPIVNSINHQR